MKKPEKINVHLYEFNGEKVELVLDMRAKNLITRYAAESGVTSKDNVMMIVTMFVAMINSAAIRTGKPDEMVTIDDILESDFDLNEMAAIVNDVRTAAYKMEYKQDNSDDLYADEVADNETPREGVN